MSKECVSELEGHLRDMLNLKPPGVTKGKVDKITELCNENIKSESILIQRIYTHFKKTPPTHKLGVLYVIDSVMRGWVEQAKKAGQALGQPSPAPGTFAAGASLVTELLGSFMNEMINTAPAEHKARIIKLVDIWDRGETFPRQKLAEYRQRLAEPSSNAPQSTTPTGSPPNNDLSTLTGGGMAAAGAAPAPDTSSILQALADMAKSNSTPGGLPAPTSSGNISNLGHAFQQNISSSVNPGHPVQPHNAQSVSMPGAMNGANGAQNPFGAMSSAPNFGQNMPPAGQPGAMQANPPVTAEALQQQVQLIQMLQAQGVPQEQWAAVLQVLMSTGAVGQVTNNSAAPQWQPPAPNYGGNESRDRNGYGDQYDMRSPTNRYRSQRSRSRSPGGRRRDFSPPRRRDSPTYGNFGRDADRSGRGGQGRGGDYRRRSPDRFNRNASPMNDQELPPPGPRKLDFDRSLPPNHIKVLSRTLFVGGVTSSESHLRGIFSQFGLVQTCIVNVDKRHAFVKMLNRADAMSAKHGMESYKSPDMQLRTRWGVGFGPRDCSNYQTGVSIIPLDRLTDADRKWMLTAEYGGTGGKPLEAGLVIEEPDIEIGAGVSSKAISRRMQTDKSGQAGPRSSRDPGSPQGMGSSSNQLPLGNPRFRQDNDHSNGPTNNNSGMGGMPPGMPGFGFPFQGMPGMPPGFQFPPGFAFPGQAAPGTGPPGTS